LRHNVYIVRVTVIPILSRREFLPAQHRKGSGSRTAGHIYVDRVQVDIPHGSHDLGIQEPTF
jgi:hypothetical protein